MKNSHRDGLVVSISLSADEKAVSNAIRAFTKKVRNSGLLQEVLDKKHYEKPSVKKKKKHNRAVRMMNMPEKEE